MGSFLKDPLATGCLFERFSTQELTKFNHMFLMAGGAKVPAFAGKWMQIFDGCSHHISPGQNPDEGHHSPDICI